jgi:hypothetical protein
MSGQIRWAVDRQFLVEFVESIIAHIRADKDMCTCVKSSPHEYDSIRNCLKSLFDNLESDHNRDYLGVLEWSFVQEVREREGSNFPNCLSFESIIKRFAKHPNINVV